MSTFYLLPSRPQIGERFAGYLNAHFPGLNWSKSAWADLAEALAGIVAEQPDVFIVYRDELPAGEETLALLRDGYGAAAGDEIIEVQAPAGSSELRWQRSRISAA